MPIYFDDIFKNEPERQSKIHYEPVSADYKKFIMGTRLNDFILQGDEARRAADVRKKAIADLNNYLDKIRLKMKTANEKLGGEFLEDECIPRIIQEIMPPDITDDECIRITKIGEKFEESKDNTSRVLLKNTILKALDEYEKENNGLFDLNQSDDQLIANYTKIFPLLCVAEPGKDKVNSYINSIIKNTDCTAEEKEKLERAKSLIENIQGLYSCLSSRFDLILSPSFELFGTTKLPEAAQKELETLNNDKISNQDNSKMLLSDQTDYQWIDKFAREKSINKLIKGHDLIKLYGEQEAFDDSGLLGKGMILLGNVVSIARGLPDTPQTNNIYLKDENGNWVKLTGKGDGLFEFKDNLDAAEQKRISSLYALRSKTSNIEKIDNLEKVRSVFTKNGINLCLNPKDEDEAAVEGSPISEAGKWIWDSLLKDGEVYYRDAGYEVHHITVKGTSLSDTVVTYAEYVENMSKGYEKGLKGILNPADDALPDPEFVKMYAMEKAEPGNGMSYYMGYKLGKMADALDNHTTLGYTSDAYENVVHALRNLSLACDALGQSELEEALKTIQDMANAYLAGKEGENLSNYAEARVAEMNSVADYLKNSQSYIKQVKEITGTKEIPGIPFPEIYRKNMCELFERAIQDQPFDLHKYASYKALKDAEGVENVDEEDRKNAVEALENGNILKLMDEKLNKDGEIYGAESLDKYYSATAVLQKYIDSVKVANMDAVTENLKEVFKSPEMEQVPENYVCYLKEQSVAQINKKFPDFGLRIIDIDADGYISVFESLFRQNSLTDIKKDFDDHEIQKELAKLLDISPDPTRFDRSMFTNKGNTLSDTLKNTFYYFARYKSNDKCLGEETFKAMKKDYIEYRSRVTEKETIAKITEQKMFVTTDNALQSMYGHKGFVADLIKLLETGDSFRRGSSALYKEIKADLKKLQKYKPDDPQYDVRYGKVLLHSIAEKARQYISSHENREMTYSLDSYEGRRIDNMRRVSASINAYCDTLENSKLYNRSLADLPGERIDQYAEVIKKKFENSRFNATLLSECIGIERVKSADINLHIDPTYNALDANMKNILVTFGPEIKIMHKGLGNKKVTLNEAKDIFEKTREFRRNLNYEIEKYNGENAVEKLKGFKSKLEDVFGDGPEDIDEEAADKLFGRKLLTGNKEIDYGIYKDGLKTYSEELVRQEKLEKKRQNAVQVPRFDQ